MDCFVLLRLRLAVLAMTKIARGTMVVPKQNVPRESLVPAFAGTSGESIACVW